ncbi:AaceriAEL266Wp [[Ashbya] aceris (nom. inval.)]|nr:AaceriAEL266Wp [[Ashbya] aceris (nom. inval.)]
MLEPLKNIVSDLWLKTDTRKREYGSLDEWKQQRGQERIGRPRRRASARYKVTKPSAVHQSALPLPVERPGVGTVRRNERTWWDRLCGVFSAEQRDLHGMRDAFSNFRLPPTEELEGRRRRGTASQRIARSETFKKRVLEKMYDDRMLEQLRAGSRGSRPERPALPGSDADQVVLLQNRLHKLERQLFETQKELELAKKKLMFAHEKTKLFESLLDDANVDDDYVKSRRRITNLRATTDNQPALRSLSPSPQRPYPVNPLFTSSPIRQVNDSPRMRADKPDDYYAKYPTIPKTELLNKQSSENAPAGRAKESLSPVRIDYSKYSSPRRK